jgi:hypothetical protein
MLIKSMTRQYGPNNLIDKPTLFQVVQEGFPFPLFNLCGEPCPLFRGILRFLNELQAYISFL